MMLPCMDSWIVSKVCAMIYLSESGVRLFDILLCSLQWGFHSVLDSVFAFSESQTTGKLRLVEV